MKKIWKIRRDEEAVSPVIATILMVAITVVLAAVLYIMVTSMTTGPTSLDSLGGTLTTTTGGWLFTCTSGTKDFPKASAYVMIQSDIGASKVVMNTISGLESANGQNITWHDNNDDDKLNAGDTLYIKTGAYSTTAGTVSIASPVANGAASDDKFQILTSNTILFDRTLP